MFGILSHFAPLRNKICELGPISTVLKPPRIRAVVRGPKAGEPLSATCRRSFDGQAQHVGSHRARPRKKAGCAKTVTASRSTFRSSRRLERVANARPGSGQTDEHMFHVKQPAAKSAARNARARGLFAGGFLPEAFCGEGWNQRSRTCWIEDGRGRTEAGSGTVEGEPESGRGRLAANMRTNVSRETSTANRVTPVKGGPDPESGRGGLRTDRSRIGAGFRLRLRMDQGWTSAGLRMDRSHRWAGPRWDRRWIAGGSE